MSIAFAIGFGSFLVLMAGLAVVVLRFAARESRRRRSEAVSGPGSDPESEPGPETN
jgi:hypothetical protein